MSNDPFNNPNLTIPGPGAPTSAPEKPTDEPAPLRVRPGRRAGMTVWAGSGEVERREGTPSGTVPAQAPAPTGPLIFAKAGTGTRIAGSMAGLEDTVDLGGAIGETSVGSALHNGWLTDAPGGGYMRAGEALGPGAEQPQQASEQQPEQQPQDQQQAQEPAAEREYLASEDEALLCNIEQYVGAQNYANLEAFFVEGQPIPQHVAARIVAERFDGNTQAFQQAVAKATRPFVQQAEQVIDAAIGQGMSEHVTAWALQDPRGRELLNEAKRLQVNERDTSGYTKLAGAYIIELAKTNPEGVVAAIAAGGNSARIVNGQVVVDVKDAGEMELEVAVRLGGLGRKRGRRS